MSLSQPISQRLYVKINAILALALKKSKCSDRSIEARLYAISGDFDKPTDRRLFLALLQLILVFDKSSITYVFHVADVEVDSDVEVADVDECEVGGVKVCMSDKQIQVKFEFRKKLNTLRKKIYNEHPVNSWLLSRQCVYWSVCGGISLYIYRSAR